MQAKRAEHPSDFSEQPQLRQPPSSSPTSPESSGESQSSSGERSALKEMTRAASASALPSPANEPLAFGCLVIGKDVMVSGSISAPGSVRVEGRIDGEIEAADVLVLLGGTVVGEVVCETSTIDGTLRGSVVCSEQMMVSSSAKIEGDLQYHKELVVKAGAQINAMVNHRADPAPLHRVIAPEKNEHRVISEQREARASLMARMFGSTKN